MQAFVKTAGAICKKIQDGLFDEPEVKFRKSIINVACSVNNEHIDVVRTTGGQWRNPFWLIV
jgi:hypothetical protein